MMGVISFDLPMDAVTNPYRITLNDNEPIAYAQAA